MELALELSVVFESLMLYHGPDEGQGEKTSEAEAFYELKGSKLHLNACFILKM